MMKLVVGLGNPGRRYQGTRHNAGYDVLDQWARQLAAPPPRKKFQGRWTEVTIQTEKVGLLWPETYMNLSGASVQGAVQFFRLAPEDLLVVCDDFQLPLGKIRVRPRGSAGGQKGLADILQRLGTQEVPRLRIGIGPLPPHADPADFVLSRFLPEERPLYEQVVQRAAQAVEDWVRHGITWTMNRYNATLEGAQGDQNRHGSPPANPPEICDKPERKNSH